MKNQPAATSGNLDLRLPQSWDELTDRQLRFLFRLLSKPRPEAEVKLLCLLRFSGLSLVGRVDAAWLVKAPDGRLAVISAIQLAEALPALDFLCQPPPSPRLVSRWRRLRHIPLTLEGVPFEKYIIIENLYQGYLHSQDDALLRQIADIVYPGRRWWHGPFPKFILTAVFFFVVSLKNYLAALYPDFFQPMGDGEPANLLGVRKDIGVQLRDSMNAQLRALTKGDVTKEAEILSLDTHRALTELNAQAREYAELKAKFPS